MFDFKFKKGTMFGKLSQLDHINFFSSKKGAMFGLDARIALAIFGALSVISGAALYSAIQESKVTAIITEKNEIENAVSAFMLDTGELPIIDTVWNLSIYDLVQTRSGLSNWKGPYVNYEKDNQVDDYLIHPKYGVIALAYRIKGEGDSKCLQSSPACLVHISFGSLPESIKKAIETKIDGTVNPGATENTGQVAYNSNYIHIATSIVYDPKDSINP